MCSEEDLNLHEKKFSQGPQPCASTIPPPEHMRLIKSDVLYPQSLLHDFLQDE